MNSSFISNGSIIYEPGRWIKKELPEVKVVFKKITKKALRDFYLRPKQFYTQLKRVNFNNLFQAAESFFESFF